MLDVKVSLKRGDFVLNAELHDSGFICLSGLNGSGKSSLLNVIAGTVRPDSGYVRINSRDVTWLEMERRGVVLVNPGSLIPHLEVDRHLRWGVASKRLPVNEDLIHRVRDTLGINYQGRVSKLSLGMRERVSLATAYLSKPKAVLVDEAFSNIDHREDFMRSYAALCKEDAIDLVHTTQQKSDSSFADHHYDLVAGTATRAF